MKTFDYWGSALLNDGTSVLLDFEEHGWADKEVLAKVVQWTLLPKDEAKTMKDQPFPFVVVNIPEGGKPVFKSRVYGTIGMESGNGGPLFRCYAVGYKLGRKTTLIWALPTGDIEVGDSPTLADALLTHIKSRMKEMQQENN